MVGVEFWDDYFCLCFASQALAENQRKKGKYNKVSLYIMAIVWQNGQNYHIDSYKIYIFRKPTEEGETK